MLFNSHDFIFGFLPLTLAGFFLLGRFSRDWALGWISASSLLFYAWWRPVNVLIIAPAIAVNYVAARGMLRLRAGKDGGKRADAVLALGIVFNVVFLGYFKYRVFLASAINDLAGTDLGLVQVILPLGISFITFQKIAFLVDVHGGRVQSFTLREYVLFVLFFPQLIAGPIVHFRELMPQFRQLSRRISADGLPIGLTLFFCGLFKKTVLADGIAPHVTPIYELAASGADIGLIAGWVAALGFTLQIYFDFSGYSDMALGLGRCFGVRLPPNFDSPLKASNIIDFWSRWHMTLTRFLTAYLYNPLLLWLTRRRLARGAAGLRAHGTTPGAFLSLLAMPTLLTMFVSGLWHGAGYLFVLWGLLHGVYLTLDHAWRLFAPRKWRERGGVLARPAAHALTFLCVVFSMVLFRSSTLQAAGKVLAGMTGLGGIDLPPSIHAKLVEITGALPAFVSASTVFSAQGLVFAAAWLVALLGIALGLPNTLQIMGRFEPALQVRRFAGAWPFGWPLEWTPTLGWALAISAVAVAGVLRIQGKSEFLYWQF